MPQGCGDRGFKRVILARASRWERSLNRNPQHARELLTKLLGPITLRRDSVRLIAELRGNLPALLQIGGEALYNPGAGSPALRLPTKVYYLYVRGPTTAGLRRALRSSITSPTTVPTNPSTA